MGGEGFTPILIPKKEGGKKGGKECVEERSAEAKKGRLVDLSPDPMGGLTKREESWGAGGWLTKKGWENEGGKKRQEKLREGSTRQS